MNTEIESKKKCTKCGVVKPTSEFSVRNNKGVLRRECKTCHNTTIAAWRKAHLKQARASVATWTKANSEQKKATNAAWDKANLERTNERRRIRYATDFKYKTKVILRGQFGDALKNSAGVH
jgi:hypothetical protein